MQWFAQAPSKSVAEPEALRMSPVFEQQYPPTANSRGQQDVLEPLMLPHLRKDA